MKKIILIVTFVLGALLFHRALAQRGMNFTSNISAQPIWGPTGYDHVEYYYLPDIDVFYYVPQQQYFYQQNGQWVNSFLLPPQLNTYDLYNGYKVVINQSAPYRHVKTYRKKYRSYKGRRGQEIIRDSQDAKYFEIKDHPQHDKWEKDHHGTGRKNN